MAKTIQVDVKKCTKWKNIFSSGKKRPQQRVGTQKGETHSILCVCIAAGTADETLLMYSRLCLRHNLLYLRSLNHP